MLTHTHPLPRCVTDRRPHGRTHQVRGTFSFSDLYTDVLSCTAPVDDPRVSRASLPEEEEDERVRDVEDIRLEGDASSDPRLYAHAGMLASAKVSPSGPRAESKARVATRAIIATLRQQGPETHAAEPACRPSWRT